MPSRILHDPGSYHAGRQFHFVESAEEFQGLLEVFREVFDWEESEFPDSSYLANLLENPQFLVLVAEAENQIVGGLTAYILPGYQTKKSSIFIYDLGVATSFQWQGIGKSLIDKLLDYAKKAVTVRNRLVQAYSDIMDMQV